MASIFTRIIKGEIPCHRIAENANFLAFLDINPLQVGHTLVIPKQEIDEFFDLSKELLSEIMVFSQPISQAIKEFTNCERIGVTVIGLEVPHAHVHLIPINGMNDMNFGNAKKNFDQEQLSKIASEIKSRIKS